MRNMVERSIFTIEEDPNSPNDLQIVSKRYIRGKDEVKEIGHDQPMKANYDEDVEASTDQDISEQMGDNAEEERGVQADPQEILWTKSYQGNVHEGVEPETDRVVHDMVSDLRFFDMLSDKELGDDFMKDSTCEVPGMVKQDSGKGADRYNEFLLNDAAAPEVPWFAVRKSWFSQKPPLPKKAIQKIAKEENLPKDHFDIEKDIRQRVLQEEPLHKFSNGKVQPGYLVLIEARTNCLRKHFPGTDMNSMGQSVAPPPQQNIYGESYLGNTLGQSTVPPPQRKIYDENYIGTAYPAPVAQPPQYYSYPIPPQFQYQYGMPPPVYENAPPVILSAKELEYNLGKIRFVNNIFKDKSKKDVQAITKMMKLPLDTSIGELSLTLTPFTPPDFVPFKNVQNFINNPPASPTFKNLAEMMKAKAPSPPAFDLSIDFKTFELSKPMQDEVTKATDALTKAVTIWTNKSPAYEFKWTEVLPPGKSYSASDKNVMTALMNAIAKSRDLYQYKGFNPLKTDTWEPNLTRSFKGVNAAEDIMSGMVKAFIDGITAGMSSLKDASGAIWNVVKGLPKNVIDNLKTNMDLIKAKGTTFGTNLKAYGDALKDHVMNIIEAVKTDIGEVKDFILAWVKGLTSAIMADAADLQTYVINLFNSFSAWVKTNITTLVSNVKAEIGKVVNSAVTEAKKIVADIQTTVTNMVEKVKGEMTATYNELKTTFTTAVNKVKADFQVAYDKLMASYNQLVSSLTQTVDIVKKQGEILTDQIKKVVDVQATTERIQKAYTDFVQTTGTRFSVIEEKMKSMGASIPAIPTGSSGGEKKGLFASLFSGPVPVYPPAGSPPAVQYPYAYPGAPRTYGTPVPWYDYEYTEVDMPAIDFEKNPAPQATHGLGHISVLKQAAKLPFKEGLKVFQKHLKWTFSKEGKAEQVAQAKKMGELIRARKFADAKTFAKEAPGGMSHYVPEIAGFV